MEEEKRLERIIKEIDSSPISPGGSGAALLAEDDDLVFPGFRFHPTDQELVGFYLTRKVEKKPFSIDIIKEIDIYKHDPGQIFQFYKDLKLLIFVLNFLLKKKRA